MHLTARNFTIFAAWVADNERRVAREATGLGGETPAALVMIGTCPGQSVERLRRVLGLSQSGTVRLVDRLEARGWVTRIRGSGREVALHLTDEGLRARAELLGRWRQTLEGLLGTLTPAEREQLGSLLGKVVTPDALDSPHGRLHRLTGEPELRLAEAAPELRGADDLPGVGDPLEAMVVGLA